MEESKLSQIKKFYPGCIIYKYDNSGSNLIQRRIVIYKENKDWFIVREIGSKKEFNISSDEIINEWILLNPDAVITFNICKLQQGRDVLICLHNTKTMDPIPDVICRQSISDMYTEASYKISPTYKMTGKEILFVGASFTKETCPADVEYNVLLSCESVESTTKCAYYITDDLEDILSFVRNMGKFDKTLCQIREAGIETSNKMNIPVDGYRTTLKDLLISCRFMDDIHRSFNIKHLTFDLSNLDSVINPRVDPRFVTFMTQVVEKQITGMYVQKFSKEIDLSEIKRDYVLGIPYDEENRKQRSAKDLYIIGYDLVEK